MPAPVTILPSLRTAIGAASLAHPRCADATLFRRLPRLAAVVVLLASTSGCSVFDACSYGDARCNEGALEVCDCEGKGGGQLFTGCKTPTAWVSFASECREGDVCVEGEGGAVCVPFDDGPCDTMTYESACLSDSLARTCVAYFGSNVVMTPTGGVAGVISEVPCREGETCQSGEVDGDPWAGCVTPTGGDL